MSSGEVARNSILQLVTDATSGRGYHDGVRLGHLQEIKRIGKLSHGCIRILFDAILLRLESPDCEVRIAALELWHALFDRSALFRKLGSCKFDIFLRCVVGKRRAGRWELPGPHGAAEELRRQGLGLVQEWNIRYGHVLPRLRLGYRYLKQSPGIEFPCVDGGSVGRDPVLPDVVRQAQEELSAGEEQWKIVIRQLETGDVSVARHVGTSRDADIDAEEEDGEAWEDVDLGGDEAVVVPLSDTYRQASSQIIPCVQRILSICRENIDRTGVRETMDRAVELNAALVAACATYECRVGENARERMEKERRGSVEQNNLNRNTMKQDRKEEISRATTRMPEEKNPMQCIRDPAAARAKPPSRKSTSRPSKTTTSNVLAKLASIAPVVPVSGFARVWDSDAPPMYAGSHSMEVSNHWGPVDVHQELPKDRLDALFLIDQSKVTYQAGSSVQREARTCPVRENVQETRQMHMARESSVQRDALDASGLEGRQAEKKYNEELLRSANMGYLSALDDLPCCQQTDGAASQPGRKIASKRKIPVHERLAKKFFMKRKKVL